MKYPDILERFLSYVKIDTQSSDTSESFPSTAKQKDLAAKLKPELEALGLQDVQITPWGYVLASWPTNQNHKVPTIALLAHLDTSPDVSGTGVEPKLHQNFQGQDLLLSASDNVVLKVDENPLLKQQIGKTIITASGNTLLGADDKAGIAAIMDAMTYLAEHPETPRPEHQDRLYPRRGDRPGRGTHQRRRDRGRLRVYH